MANRKSVRITIIALGLGLGLSCAAQVLSVSRIKDPQGQLLQQRYMDQLQQISQEAAALHFPYPFYFSEKLDIDEVRQKQLPQGSIHFDRFNGETVLQITGNYYVSYSAKVMNANQRSRKTFQDVVLPLLRVAVKNAGKNLPIDAYAFEIAHHVRAKVLKVDTEGPENLMVLIPRTLAERLVKAKEAEEQQAVLLESEVFLNGEIITLWLIGDEAPADVNDHYLARHKTGGAPASSGSAPPAEPGTMVSPILLPESELADRIRARSKVAPDLSVARMEKLESTYADVMQKLSTDLKDEAHFVAYAPPAFIGFRDGAYLQLNMKTELEPAGEPSQYRMAALAFDLHISHMLRPVSRYFHDNPQFEGIDFSTTVRQGAQSAPESVEFVVPFSALVCYQKYDCTGQELINRSIVLINGERVTLDLQRAEAGVNARIQ